MGYLGGPQSQPLEAAWAVFRALGWGVWVGLGHMVSVSDAYSEESHLG